MDNSNYSSEKMHKINFDVGSDKYSYIIGDSVSTHNINIYLVTKEEHEFLERCKELGMIGSHCRTYNEGNSDYSKHVIQPWSIWQDYNLNPWDADIIKRILRTKKGESRELDYKKIIHICNERLRQLEWDTE